MTHSAPKGTNVTTSPQNETSDSTEPSAQPLVAVVGLGFVGAAMSLAVARARDPKGKPWYRVVGIDLPTPLGLARIDALGSGHFPFETEDSELEEAAAEAQKTGNFSATSDVSVLEAASIIVVSIHLDLVTDTKEGTPPRVAIEPFRKGIQSIAAHMSPGALVIIETTVPPGTCAKVVAPEIEAGLEARGVARDAYLLAHSYERVMPGPDYLNSIVNAYRVYSGHSSEAADACDAFLSKVLNVADYPLTRLAAPVASETAKLLENSYRALNIAFVEEWSRFAEAAGVDLFEVIEAIHMRPTHKNLRYPGFGVGGYCLTKDPLFAEAGAREILEISPHLEFPFCHQAVAANRNMPVGVLDVLENLVGSLDGKRILLMGVSYRDAVSDTRFSPSEIFARAATKRGASVVFHDPLVKHWYEMNLDLSADLPSTTGADTIVFAVSHSQYKELDISEWLGSSSPLVLDANNVLSAAQRAAFADRGCRVESIGRGMTS